MSAPLSPQVTVRAETLRRILTTALDHAWEFSVWEDIDDGEPRIRDTDAAERLGYSQVRDVRQLIENIWPETKRPHVRRVVRRTSMPRGGTRDVTVSEYWLTEAELLKLCARARTEAAEAILDEMIAVYMVVRRHLAGTVPVVAHTRQKPHAPARFSSLDDRAAASPLPPLAERLDRATRITHGFQEWDVVVPVGGAIVAALQAVAAKRGVTMEQQALSALFAWSAQASSLGFV